MSTFYREGRVGRACWISLAMFVVLATFAGPATGQGTGRQIPSARYGIVFGEFYEGEYKDALKDFQSEGRGAIKLGLSRWVDSICYHTMIGECYYHMGQLPDALQHYTAACNLYAEYGDWMTRVQFPATIRPSPRQIVIPWGQNTRGTVPGHFSTSMLIARGRLNNNDVVRQGGVVEQLKFWQINVPEIVRCTSLAMRRRAELMGPVGYGDPLTANLVALLSRRPAPPNHWSQSWIDVQLGIALAAAGKGEEAAQYLKRGSVTAGSFDHPLTGAALLVLGHVTLEKALAEKDPNLYASALKSFENAAYSAAIFSDVDVLEEAFRYAALTHLLTNRKTVYAPLAAAARWARLKRLRHLEASLLLLAAENYALLGNSREAMNLLGQARATVGRRTMGGGWIGARLNYLTAQIRYQGGQIASGTEALAATMAYQRSGSRRLFRIGLADGLYTSGNIPDRIAMEYYRASLSDPSASDWHRDPMESLTLLLTPHSGPLERWAVAALRRNNAQGDREALEIADRLRRHRFFTTLTLGGRLQSFRWILEAPPQALDQQALLVRQGLLAEYPAYADLSKKGQALIEALRAKPLVPEEADEIRLLTRDLGELAKISEQQEAMLHAISLRREAAELVFPPIHPTEKIQEQLPPGHAVMAFLVAGGDVHAFVLTRKRLEHWKVEASAAQLQKKIADLLRRMGQSGSNDPLTQKELTDNGWKELSGELLALLLEGSKVDLSQPFEELIVVPDGPLWYLPFEALQVTVGDRSLPLISRARIRYAPLVSLAIPDGRLNKPLGKTAVVVGNLFPRDDESVAEAEFQRLTGVVPHAIAVRNVLPAPTSICAATLDRLIVLDDVRSIEQGPLAWAPIQAGRGRPGDALGDWMSLPWGGPEVVVLPGYHTAAESSLRGVREDAAGREVFLSVCGLMSSGARTILIGRWRPGGQTSFDLVREFCQELPHTTASAAWQRSVLLAAGSQLRPDREPRVTLHADTALRAVHPFFWSGYMLIDTGVEPLRDAGANDPVEAPAPALRPAAP